MPDSLLCLKSVCVGYGPGDVLHDFSLEIGAHEIVTLLGANGAGKTTTLGALSGLLPLRGGQVLWQGEDITSWSPDRRLSAGIVLCPEGRRIFPRLTVEENLAIGGYTKPSLRIASLIEAQFARFPILAERRKQLGGTLSGGEQQMLAIGRALMSEPRLLMLDEPSLGLAPLIVEKIFEILVEIHREGTPVLLVEQNANQALRIAQRGYVLSTGAIVKTGTGKELLESDEVRQAYLGEA